MKYCCITTLFWFAFFGFAFSEQASAQSDSTSISDTADNGNKLLAIPVVFYTPETRLGFGATAIYNFRFRGESKESRSCQIAPGFAYTLEKQLLLYTPFTLFWDDQRFYSFGEVGYYKYFYDFFGVGNENPTEYIESYTVNFPRIQLNLLRQVKTSSVYLGPQYWFEHYDVKEREMGKQLIGDSIVGSAGGFTSGLGFMQVLDTRDQIYYPKKGVYTELMVQGNNPAIGSSFKYWRVRFTGSQYTTFPWKHTLATNLYTDILLGDAPFHQLAFLGGTKRMRGFYEGRYRDNKALILQTEYRMPLFWRFKAAFFGGAGTVWDTQLEADHIRLNYGAGLRILLNKEENVHVRLDAGFAQGESGFYITIGEAF